VPNLGVVKKGDGWYLRIREPRRKGAEHTFRIEDALSEAEAKAMMADAYVAYVRRQRTLAEARATAPSPTSPTVAAYLRGWLDRRTPDLRPQTVPNYRWLIEGRIIPHLGEVRLHELTRARIAEHLEAERGREKRGGGLVSARTVQMERNLLHKALGDAVGDQDEPGLLTRNPVERVRATVPKRRPPQTMTPAQIRAFMRAAKASPNHALYATALRTGARIGELLGLRWEDVDLERATLRIVTTLETRGRPVRGEAPKRQSSIRTVPLGRSTVALLRAHRERQAAAIARADGLWRDTGIVFPNTEGGYQRLNNLTRRKPGKKKPIGDYARTLERAGLPWFKPHALRHTSATEMVRTGHHLKVVAERLGHSDVRTTMAMYSHVQPGMGQAAAEDADALFADDVGEDVGESESPPPEGGMADR